MAPQTSPYSESYGQQQPATGQAYGAAGTPPGGYQATSTPGAYQPPVGQQPAAAGAPAVADAYGAGQQPAAGYARTANPLR